MTHEVDRSSPEFLARVAAYHAEQQSHIDTIGWSLQGVFPTSGDDGWPFTYTLGRGLAGKRDLIVVGTAQAEFLNGLCEGIDCGDVEFGVPFVFPGTEYQMLVAGIDRDDELDHEFMTGARRVCPDYAAAIVVFEDDQHRWPWQIDRYTADEQSALCLGRPEQLAGLVEAAG